MFDDSLQSRITKGNTEKLAASLILRELKKNQVK